MSELQTEQSETIEEAELAPATGDNQQKQEEGLTDEQQAIHTEAEKLAGEIAKKGINKQHFKFREEERKRIALEQEKAELEAKLAAQNVTGEVVIPPIPDQYDDDFEQKMVARDEAVQRKAQSDAQKHSETLQLNAQNEADTRRRTEQTDTLLQGYAKNITTLGLDAAEINDAGNIVIQNGLSSDLAEFILDQEDGPLIMKYLSLNPIAQDDLNRMSPLKAAAMISSSISTAASQLKPQASNAPDPTEILSGRGVTGKESPFLKGASFE